MQIAGIRAHRQWQPFRDGRYATSGGAATGFDSLVVAVRTDSGVTGWGEMAPLGSFYAPAFAEGARAAVEPLGRALLGADPGQWRLIGAALDAALKGHPYAKSALDMACCDAAARVAGRPLCELLGGLFPGPVALYRPVPPGDPAAMAGRARELVEQGYGRLQVKVGGDPAASAGALAAVVDAVGDRAGVVADANGGFPSGRALEFLRATRELDYTFEQPCSTLEECRLVRRACDRPLWLDESIDSLRALLDARSVADGVTVKVSRVGGVSRAAALRDLACDLGLTVTVEDTGGSSIDTAATLHLAASTPAELRGPTVDFERWVTVANAAGLPPAVDGTQPLPVGPGLGVETIERALGEPFWTAGQQW